MKAIKLLACSILLSPVAQPTHAQLLVDSLGHVCIGSTTEAHYNMLGTTPYYFSETIETGNYQHGLYIQPRAIGLHIIKDCHDYMTNYGIWIYHKGSTNSNSYGIYSMGGGSTKKNYAVLGTLRSNIPDSASSAAIYGSINAIHDFEYPGKYAGYFRGDVCVTGTLMANLTSPAATINSHGVASTASVVQMSDPMAVSEKLKGISILEIHQDTPTSNAYRNKATLNIDDELHLDENGNITTCNDLDADETSNNTIPSVRYSLAADELRSIYPELVYEDKEGNWSINYIEMVPLLVQSIKELKAEIDELKGATPRKQGASRKNGVTTDMADAESDLISLSQNDPNPFTTETTIAVSLPESIKNAAIIIYDMSGKKVKQIDVTGRRETTIDVTSEGLTQGMYLYSLIADGKVVSTKRMILN